MNLSERERAIRQRLKSDFAHYSSRCLRIRTKAGAVVPFALNEAQRHIHRLAEEQRARKGWVRKIVLKGRQQGCSTYIEGRFYWRVTHLRGVRAFILTHEQDATNNLFEMAERYHANCPEKVRPSTGAANAKELFFDLLDSGYKVGTAGTRGVGRSSTIQYFHGSEVAYWPFAETHAAGVMQAIPDAPGTESWLESTANGTGNYFHSMWMVAERGEGDYEPIFVPWFWQLEYRRSDVGSIRHTPAEEALIRAFKLDDQQLAWRRAKIKSLDMGEDGVTDGGATGEDRFRQEYPNTADEAFDAPVVGAYYAQQMAELAAEKRFCRLPWDPMLPVYTAWDLGVGDSTSIWFAQQIGPEVRLVDFYEASGEGMAHYANLIKSKPYTYGEHILPHDAGARMQDELGKTRVEILASLGIKTRVLASSNIDDGINAVRVMLPRCWFDEEKCKRGIAALKQYRREFDEARKAFRSKPFHDWTSHPADAFRYLAVGLKPPASAPKDLPKSNKGWVV